MSRGEMDALRRIGRRQFIEMCACTLAFAAVGCGRRSDQARAKHSTITVLYPYDEWALGLDDDMPAKFLVFLPLASWGAKGELKGRLAERWEHSADYRTWTIHLRKDVRWHDGVPVTAHDVKFTMDLYMHPAVLWVPPGAYAVTVLDDRTYTITYHRREIGSPLDDWTVYYPKHLLEKLDPKEFYNWEFWTHPVGNGPYRYVRHVPKTMMEFEANPDYYRGKPKIERVVLKFGDTSSSGALTELLSGNVDAVTNLRRADVLKTAGDLRFHVYDHVGTELVYAVFWNHRNPLFCDAKVRRALTLAINRRELLQALNLPPETPIIDAPFTDRQLRHRDFSDPLPYDPELAKRLLDEAGWRDRDRDGLRERHGRPFRFAALAPSFQGLDKAAIYIQAQLHRAGIRMDVVALEYTATHWRMLNGEFEAAIYLMHRGVELRFFGERSPVGNSNPKVIELLNKAQTTFDPDKEDQIYRELARIFQADVPMTFLYPDVLTTIAHRRVRGLSGCPYRGDLVWCMEELWLEDESAR